MNEENEIIQLKKCINFYKNESLRFKKLIDTAKTKYKQKFYRDKLKANNEIFSKYLYLYDKLTEKELTKDE